MTKIPNYSEIEIFEVFVPLKLENSNSTVYCSSLFPCQFLHHSYRDLSQQLLW